MIRFHSSRTESLTEILYDRATTDFGRKHAWEARSFKIHKRSKHFIGSIERGLLSIVHSTFNVTLKDLTIRRSDKLYDNNFFFFFYVSLFSMVVYFDDKIYSTRRIRYLREFGNNFIFSHTILA